MPRLRFLAITLLFIGFSGYAHVAAVFAQPPSSLTQLSVSIVPYDPLNRSAPGSRNREYLLSDTNAQWTVLSQDTRGARKPDYVQFQVRMFQSTDGLPSNYVWFITFSSIQLSRPLEPGSYSEAMIAGREASGHPGLNIANGCSYISGSFTITELEYEVGRITRFAASFSQKCEDNTGARTGRIYYNSLLAATPGAPFGVKTSSYLPEAASGKPYSQALEVEGGIPPFTWEVFRGQLAPGLILTTGGLLYGTPSTAGSFTFLGVVSDSSGAYGLPNKTNSREFTVVVKDALLSVTSTSTPNAIRGIPYSYILTANGGDPPYIWKLVDGQLPSGLDINSDGLISGTAISAGAFNFTAEVSDSLNRSARQAYLLKVIAPPRITEVRYKAKKRKLTIMGELFDEMAIILVDGKEVSPTSKDSVSIAIKKLSLDRGRHEVRIVNPDGGTAAIEIAVT